MFKPKKQSKPLPVENNEDVEEENLEEDIEEEEPEESTPVKKNKKQNKSNYNIGDIIPIQQVAGYQVVREIINGQPIVTSTERLSEAEILSFIYQQ